MAINRAIWVDTFKEDHPGTMTEAQARKRKLAPVEGAEGVWLWNGFTYYQFYRPDELRPMTEAELAVLRQEARAYRQAMKQRKVEQIQALKDRIDDCETKLWEQKKKTRELCKQFVQWACLQQCEPIENPSRMIVFDTETTGLHSDSEIIQVSIIDGDGNTLLSSYVRPYYTASWPEAQAINQISPEMVADAPYLHELAPKIVVCFRSADIALAYNVPFDVGMLQGAGIQLPDVEYIDVMKDFAVVYGDWSEYYGTYKWQKLTVAAEYYGYTYAAHDSLEDVKATLHVYKCMEADKKK